MKKTKAATGPKCTSTANSFKCALSGDHTIHCSSEKRSGQYMTWTTLDDGRVQVQVHNGKNKGESWINDAPPEFVPHKPLTLEDEPEDDEIEDRRAYEPCGAPRIGVPGGCQLLEGHDGDHFGCVHGHVSTWMSGGEINGWQICAVKRSKQAVSCQRPEEHDGPHRGLDRNHMTEWENGESATHMPKAKINLVALLLGHDFRDARAKEARRKLGMEPSLADKCPKCSHELGEHDGNKCPKPAKAAKTTPVQPDDDRVQIDRDIKPENTPGWLREPDANPGDTRSVNGKNERWVWGAPGGWGWREYTAAGKGCKGCGRHKTDCLCKEMKAAPPQPIAEPEQPSAPLTKIGSYEVHPAAARFDMLEGPSWESFLADVRANGQREAIVLIVVDGKTLLLDGRNRLRACIELGITPRFRMFGDDPGDGSDPIAFVVSINIQRRHMDETQRSHVGAGLIPLYEAQAKERQRAAGGSRPVSANLRGAVGKASEAAARAVNVSPRSVELAVKVQREAAPEVVAASKAGRIKVSTAANLATLPKQQQREIIEKIGGGELRSGKVRALVNQEKKRAVVRKINGQHVAPMPLGPFGVIYGDYPWHYDNSDQHEGSRGHLGYPTMKMEDVLAHAVETAKRAAKDCIVALWSTNLYVTRMDRVLEAYGATVRTVFTWPKPKFGVGTWGRGQTEHLVIASIGEPTHTLNEISTLFPSWKPEHPGEHSSKPAEVAELLQKHCSGPFLELFGRGPREGFAVWGAEAEKFATEAA